MTACDKTYYFAFAGYIPCLWDGVDSLTAPFPMTLNDAVLWFRRQVVDTALSAFTEGEIRAANNECDPTVPLADLVTIVQVFQSDSPIYFVDW